MSPVERRLAVGAFELGVEPAGVIVKLLAQLERARAFGEAHSGKFVIGDFAGVHDLGGASFGVREELDVLEFGTCLRVLLEIARLVDRVGLLRSFSKNSAGNRVVLLFAEDYFAVFGKFSAHFINCVSKCYLRHSLAQFL